MMNQQRRDEIAAMTVATEPGELVAALPWWVMMERRGRCTVYRA